MSDEITMEKIPENLIMALKGFNNKFRLKLIKILYENYTLSLTKIQKSVKKENGYIINHIHNLENARIVQNFIQKKPNSKEFSFYQLTDFGNLLFTDINRIYLKHLGKELMDDEFSQNLFKALGNTFRFTLMRYLTNNESSSFTTLLKITKAKKSTLINHLHKLEVSNLIQNFYKKDLINKEYSFYQKTEFAEKIINGLIISYNNFYSNKSRSYVKKILMENKSLKQKNYFDFNVSSWVLPNEPILGWIKCKSNDIYKLKIEISSNLKFSTFFNNIFNDEENVDLHSKNVVFIDSLVQKQINYVPFEMKSIKPKEDLLVISEILKIIAFNEKDEIIQKIEKEIQIINPIIKINVQKRELNTKSGFIELKMAIPKGIRVNIINFTLEVKNKDGNLIPIKTREKDLGEIPQDIPPELKFNNLIGILELNGKGPFFITFKLEYSDANGNIYNVRSNEISIEEIKLINRMLNCNYNFSRNAIMA
ncbi:MAG: hypothetical protein ACTSUG_17940 [Candidatus Helarchaeota archaeon]